MFSHSVVSGWDSCLARTHSAWLQDLMKLRPDVSLQNFCERHSSRQEVDLFGFREKHTHRVWAITEESAVAMECGVVSFWVI